MNASITVDETTQPFLPWQRVLGHPIRRLLATHDGTEGAVYATFGIEFETGEILNVQQPELPYQTDKTTEKAHPSHDLRDETVLPGTYVGRSLKSLIYYLEDWGSMISRHYFAVLETGDYLTSYPAFNYTEFAIAPFRDWKPDESSRLYWGQLELRSKTFYNAWNHSQVNPFSVYR
jgi:hypothetical protein